MFGTRPSANWTVLINSCSSAFTKNKVNIARATRTHMQKYLEIKISIFLAKIKKASILSYTINVSWYEQWGMGVFSSLIIMRLSTVSYSTPVTLPEHLCIQCQESLPAHVQFLIFKSEYKRTDWFLWEM